MTIAAGIVCTDGILICADTEYTQEYAKFQENKIWGARDYLLMTGAGMSGGLKMAFDKLAHKLITKHPKDMYEARAIVEKLIRDYYEQHVMPFYHIQHPLGQESEVSLVIAMRCEDQELALIKTEGTTTSLVENYHATGTGQDVFRYWAKRFFVMRMDMEIATHFALFMLRECKSAASFVGGASHVVKFPKDYSKTPRVYTHLFSDADVLAGFPDSAIQIIFAAITEYSDSAVDSAIKQFEAYIRDMRTRRRNYFEQLERMKQSAEEFRKLEKKS